MSRYAYDNLRPSLTVTTPAASLALLTVAELRAAAGVTDGSQDVTLQALGLSVAAAIMSECNIAIGAGGEPTLFRETLTETFYWPYWPNRPNSCDLVLSRRHNIAVTSVTVDTDAPLVVNTDYRVNPESGILSRVNSGYPISWWGQTIVVVYAAGFVTIPADLKQAATDFFRATFNEAGRDPFVKEQETEIPGVERQRIAYWVGSIPGQSSEGAVPDIVAGQLKRFRNAVVA